mmetsp:Transcript_36454/g.59939  ORF Transcript_36454/g.59939 Transcript_36454/m.59939 type:complete len:154 (-) Transcript_36454:1496-1957(-)
MALSQILYSGVLLKRNEQNHKAWNERWFVLYDNRTLSYYHNKAEFQDKKQPCYTIDLRQASAIQPIQVSRLSQLYSTSSNNNHNNNAVAMAVSNAATINKAMVATIMANSNAAMANSNITTTDADSMAEGVVAVDSSTMPRIAPAIRSPSTMS